MVSEIIDALSDDAKSITTPLLKVKVLASRIGNKDLLNWVNNELEGYQNKKELPRYRIAKATPKGNIQQGFHVEKNLTLPIMLFTKFISDELVEWPLVQGVKALEGIAHGGADTLYKEFGPDFCACLTDDLKKNGQNLTITHAWIESHISVVIQALSEIRNKLLDLLLIIEAEFPNLDSELKENSLDKTKINQIIINIMNNFNTSGDGNIVNAGNDNIFKTNITINKGNVDQLKQVLKNANVPEEDIQEIEAIIVSEKPDLEKKTLGKRTNEWIQKMVGKSLNKTWDISTEIAVKLLTETLNNFVGI